MNSDQVMMTVRVLLNIVGPLLVAKGLVSSDGLTTWTNDILTLVGAAMPVGAWVWGMFAHSASGKVASVKAGVASGAIQGVTIVGTPK